MSNQCSHQNAISEKRICPHLGVGEYDDFYLRFSGRLAEYGVVCEACREVPWDSLNPVCEKCFTAVHEGTFGQLGVVGKPEVLVAREERCSLAFVGSFEFPVRVLSAAVLRNRWIALLEDGSLQMIGPDGDNPEHWMQLEPHELDFSKPIDLHASKCGKYLAVTNNGGRHGIVCDLAWNKVAMLLDRQDYHEEQTPFPVIFCGPGDDTRIIHASNWNRLDISNPATGQCLTQRKTDFVEESQRPKDYLNFFVGELTLSSDEQLILVDGWIWHPVGAVKSINVEAWLAGNIWQSEQDLNKEALRFINYGWNVAKAFVDEKTVVLWGIGRDDEHMVDGACMYELETKKLVKVFAGPPNARFAVDEWLFAFSPKQDSSAWDLASGERVWRAEGHRAQLYNPNSRRFLHWEENTITVTEWQPIAKA
jgi:hypothetical protein